MKILEDFFSKSFIIILASCLLPLASAFPTDIYLQIQRGEKVAIGFPNFTCKENSPQEEKLRKTLQEVTKQDILYTRLFNLLEDGPEVGKGKIDFETWGKNGADILITAVVFLKEEKGELTAQMVGTVYELPAGNPIFQKKYSTTLTNARKIAHEFVADFLYRFTSDRGVSSSRIAFVNDSTGFKELYLIDYDGENLKRLTQDKSVVLLPRWSPDYKELAYTSYVRNNPDLYSFSAPDGKIKILSGRKGLNSAASFSPNGKEIVVTLSIEGYPSLYLLSRDGKIIRRLTKGKFADTSASFSSDGRKIVFVSDRPGWPQIYMMDADGSHLERLTESGYCDGPVWSPQGDKIAYSRGDQKGKHDIIVRDIGTGSEIQITQNVGNNENPSFSPDGRFIVFSSTRNKKRELFISSLNGTIQKKLADIPGNSFTPCWGP